VAVIAPREFCEAMHALVTRSQRNPATAVSDQAYQMKLRILDHFIERDPHAAAFEDVLRARIADPDPQKELSRGICCQILNSWRAGSCRYTPERHLVLPALYPADDPPAIEGEGDNDE
jgi:hypothetical protein